MSPFEIIIASIGGSAALFGIIGWLTKSLISQLLSKDIENHKSKLQYDSEIELTKLKKEIEKTEFEHQVRFSKLHDKRGEVLADLYKFLVESVWVTRSLASPAEWAGEPTKNEKYADAMNKLGEFFRFFDQHRIYIPKKLCPLIDEFIDKLRNPTIGLGIYFSIENPNENTLKEKMDVWDKAWSSAKNDIPKARQELEQEFRIILGGEGAQTFN